MREFIEKLPRFYRPVVMRMFSKIDISIVLLESMRREFQQFWPRMDVRVVPNFYAEAFDKIEKKPLQETVRIVYLSNIIYSKGILDLLEAFAELSHNYEHVELVIAGDFMEDAFYSRKQIEQMFIRRLEGLERARYIGVVSGDEKVELLAQSDIFVLPTFYPMEAFPLSIIEAMRAGNVIVATQHNYLPEIVDDRMGELVESRTPSALAACLKRIIEQPENMRAIQNYNMAYAKEHYDVARYIRRLDRIMEDALAL
jgi:glycosyltransferase involved in cell wall biosynthesis